MARRKNNDAEGSGPVKETGACCRECEYSGSFCVKGHDGKPIFCRCSKHPKNLRFASSPSCNEYIKRITPLPDSFAWGFI